MQWKSHSNSNTTNSPTTNQHLLRCAAPTPHLDMRFPPTWYFIIIPAVDILQCSNKHIYFPHTWIWMKWKRIVRPNKPHNRWINQRIHEKIWNRKAFVYDIRKHTGVKLRCNIQSTTPADFALFPTQLLTQSIDNTKRIMSCIRFSLEIWEMSLLSGYIARVSSIMWCDEMWYTYCVLMTRFKTHRSRRVGTQRKQWNEGQCTHV